MTNNREQGLVLVLVMMLVSLLMIIGLSLLGQATGQYAVTSDATYRSNALYTSEAGIEQSVQALNADGTFAGYSTPQLFFDNATQGYGTYTTTVAPAPGNAQAKIITSSGKIYKYAARTKLIASRTIEVTVVGTTSTGYSVLSGPGGMILAGSANITNSSVYVGGTLTLEGASKIGTSAKPLTVNVANKACPTGTSPGASYPATCTTTQAISLAQSTSIFGSVCATGQTSKGPNNNIKTGTGGQGLIAGCTAPDVTPPTYNRTAHIAATTTTGSATDNAYVCNSWPHTRVWPANLRLNGNVVINGSCDITIKGNVYITGTLTIGGSATVRVDNSVGTTRPTILADGIINFGNSAAVLSNGSNTSLQFTSFASNASCGATCSTITGTDLKKTSTYETVKVDGAATVPGVIFQAYWGQVTVSGSGTIGAAVGQTVNLRGAGTVTFGTTLSSGVSTWTISSYRIKYR